MNIIQDILLVEDSQNDIDLALYALREEGLANSIFVVRDGKEALDFLFCRGAFAETGFAGFETTQSRWSAGAQAIEE
jgi:hypothetical protein